MATGEWRVKYDGVCSRCGIPLHAGEIAVYERPTRSMHCLACASAIKAGVGTPDPKDALAGEPEFNAGSAGASARREYERRKAKREDHVKSRVGARLGRVILAVTDDPQSTRAWAIGARGEEKLAAALEGIGALRVLNDRRVPGTRGNIDHIVIAPSGIFVVDAKHYEGRIEIRNKGWFLRPEHRLYVGHRDCSRLAEGLTWQVDAVATSLASAGVGAAPPITPVLCFIDGDWPLLGAPREYAGVRLESPKSLRTLATATAVLDAGDIERLAQTLVAALPSK